MAQETESREEGEELATHQMNVYALESTYTKEPDTEVISAQGFGHTEKVGGKLEKPMTITSYQYEGQLQLTESDKRMGSTGETSGGGETPEKTAERLAMVLREHQNAELKKQGKPSYKISFKEMGGAVQDVLERSDRDKEEGISRVARELTPEEIDKFAEAMQESNRKAAESEKKADEERAKKGRATPPPPARKKK